MYPVTRLLVALLVFPIVLHAQVLPKEGSRLNYRMVGFSWNPVPGADNYLVEVASGTYNTQDSFRKHVVCSFKVKEHRSVEMVPSFRKAYTWRVTATKQGKAVVSKEFHHFSTYGNDRADTNLLRLRVLQPTDNYKDYFVSLDGGGVLYDMQGHPLWFMPDTNGFEGYVADLKFTPEGTCTFIYKNPYEIDFNGTLIWTSPVKASLARDNPRGEFFHHEFRKLSNGHYMVLGMQIMLCRQVSHGDSNEIVVSEDMTPREGYQLGRFGNIIEYDQSGKVVWSWRTWKYLVNSDFKYFNPADSNLRFDAHDNSFYFDERNKIIYLSFKNINRIIKIAYPSGEVIAEYGSKFKPCALETEPGFFCNQHGVTLSAEGYMYFYNLNGCRGEGVMPEVVMLKEPEKGSEGLKKVWDYTCTVEGDYLRRFFSGGNAIEMPDRSMFVCMGSEYSKVFIVDRNKVVRWSALPERFVESDQKWVPIHQYRANYIDRKELERLIWRAETGK